MGAPIPDNANEPTRDLRRDAYARPGPVPAGPAAGWAPHPPPAAQPPRPRRRRTGLVVTALVLGVALVAGAAWYLVLGPGAAPSASPTAGAGPAAPTAGAPSGSGSAGAGAPVTAGDCLHVEGVGTAAEVRPVACGSPESSYRVIDTVTSRSECPSDINGTRDTTLDGKQVTTLCLYTDWAVGDCFDTGPSKVSVRVDCSPTAGTRVVRVADIIQGSSDLGACGTPYGQDYPEGGFAVCLEAVT